MSVELVGKMRDAMFVSHANAIIYICADLLKNYVCNHLNLFCT